MAEKKSIIPKTIRANIVKTAGIAAIKPRDPDEIFDELFRDIQTTEIFNDNKIFIDLIPKKSPLLIMRAYRQERKRPNFNLADFVDRNFRHLKKQRQPVQTEPNNDATNYIAELWQELTITNRRNRGSLLALPYEYVVPGGRFQEQFYWDTYFIMLGLAHEKQWSLIEGMIKNYTYMIRCFGFIPTANRSYFLSRSQPPFFSHMIELLTKHRGQYTIVEYLPYLLRERQFWMRGQSTLKNEFSATRRVVRLEDKILLNRYFDNRSSPRPDTYIQDTSRAATTPEDYHNTMYLHLRAAAESGWDFSSRWFKDPQDINTIHTTDIVPIDLNCLLYHLESMITSAYRLIKQERLAKTYETAARRRAVAIEQYCWDEQRQFYYDYDFVKREKTSSDTLAAIFPLYVGIASKQQAAAVAHKLEKDFLKPGGLVTTLVDNDQQWDSPNGWAPMQHVAIKGLERYGYTELAAAVRERWLSTNQLVFDTHHKFIEKYDVITPGTLGGGGEYELQDGFGWTNGVFEILSSDDI